MSYRKELEELIVELRNKSNAARWSAKSRERARRQAEIIDFLINHPQDAIANLDA